MAEVKKNIPQDIAELPFEAALEELENVVRKMEQEPMPLETLFSVFERGNYLAVHCREKLGALEKRIEILKENTQDDPQWQEFR